MKLATADDQSTVTLKNKIRGLVSAYKSKKFIIDRRDNPLQILRIGIRHQFLDARAHLSPALFESFIHWVDTQLASQASDHFRSSSGFDDLAGVYDAPKVSLERELNWLSARIKALSVRINVFLELKQLVQQSAMRRDYERAIATILEIEKYFGCSMWTVQLRIALEHQAGGLERQKNYVSEVRSVFRSGLLNFVAYHTSVRNEDKTTSGKFVDDVRLRIDRHQRYEAAVKTYLKCILALEWPREEEKLAEILMVSQSHSFADIYESFVGVVQQLVRRNTSASFRANLARLVQDVSLSISDFRLDKAVLHLTEGSNESRFTSRQTEHSDSILSPIGTDKASEPVENRSSPPTDDPWTWIYNGFARASQATILRRTLRQPADLPALLGRILNQRQQEEDSFALLAKIALNFSGLSVVSGFAEISPILRPSSSDLTLDPHWVGLNSPYLGIEDIPWYKPCWAAAKNFTSSSKKGPTESAWVKFLIPLHPDEPLSPTEKLFLAAGQLNTKNYSSASDHLDILSAEKCISAAHTLLVALQIRAYRSYGSREKLIQLVAHEGAKGNQSSALLTVNEIFENFQWEDFQKCTQPLSTPIALHLWLTSRDDEEVLSWLRFSTAQFLKKTPEKLPSRLGDSTETYTPHLLVYFLRNVCVSSVLDVSRLLRGTRKVFEERQAICALLREIDPDRAGQYQSEISTINNDLALQEGQAIVDQSRIHVDAPALKRWAVKELAENYDRYLDLLKVDLRSTKDFDEVIKEILDGTLPRATFTPEHEADALLYSMLMRVAQEFLINPTFGFDFYLSKRVRHQSFIGLIRGPLEFSNLITTRESEGGEYRKNSYWMGKFSTLDHPATDAVNEALLKFGARFDEILLNAKNNLFHVRSTEKPNGLLGVEVNAQHVAFARALANPSEDIDGFIDTTLAIVWASLENSLRAVREYIAEEIQVKVAAYFDELKAGIKKIAEVDENLIEFNVKVGQSSAEVQRALDDAARWFSKTSVEAQMRLFSLEQVVKVGIDAALKAQRGFTPKIETTVKGTLTLRASALVFVHDVFFVALDNIRLHSGLKQPWVKINVSIGENGEDLQIEVRNQTRGANRISNEKSMAEIRQMIESKALGQRTRKEGSSGFVKIAAVTSQSSKGQIIFGYVSDDEFYLRVVYALIFSSEPSSEPS